MKAIKFTIASLLISFLLVPQLSCIVTTRHDNGKHKGWYKNPNNPHNPNTTNPGKTKGKSKGK
ncbi:MAG: hypothetical protein K0S33_3121 [Bacteroidetes bacterium]|jgi:hypothetical protein|nr:hypothetical protein [Bacteroidota bacterium]